MHGIGALAHLDHQEQMLELHLQDLLIFQMLFLNILQALLGAAQNYMDQMVLALGSALEVEMQQVFSPPQRFQRLWMTCI